MSLKEEFIKVGYTENDYNEIRNSYSLINMKDETISIHLKDIFAFFYTITSAYKYTMQQGRGECDADKHFADVPLLTYRGETPHTTVFPANTSR